MTTIFPVASMPVLRMAANLGLVLFLFLVGLEVDMRILFRNWRVAASVGALGMILPFGLGAYLTTPGPPASVLLTAFVRCRWCYCLWSVP